MRLADLCEVKFNMINPWAIYLHDTPHREDFVKSFRAYSSGCIRVHHPKEFAEALFEGIDEAYRNRGVTSVSFHGYRNYIEVQPSRHADDFTVYVHTGNEVTNLNNYDDSFKKFAKSNPELAESYVDQAIAHLKRLKKDIKI
jgi:murein L,D-transpeptidase YcbB/YkuD